MSFEVPKGWTRGEPLTFYGGDGPNYGCSRNPQSVLDFPSDPSEEVALKFSSRGDMLAFKHWWYSLT